MAMVITKFNKMLRYGIVWVLFIGLVIFAFVAMDIATPEPNNPKKNDVVGKIYDQEIKRDQFMSSYYSVTLDYTMRSGQELRITDQIHKEITAAAWERLAILFKAKASNISASDDNIRLRIKEIIRMISQSDYYDPSIYSAFISNFLYPRYGMNEKKFESFIAESIIIEKILEDVDQNPFIDEEEIIETFHNLNDTLIVQYSLINKESITANKIDEFAAKSYYTNNINSFVVPNKVKVNYIKFPIMDFANSVSITKKMINNTYSNQLERYRFTNDNGNEEYKSLDEVKDIINEQLISVYSAQKALDTAYKFIDDLYKENVTLTSKAKDQNIDVFSPTPFSINQVIPEIKSTKEFNTAAFNLELSNDGYYSDPVQGSENIYIIALEEKYDSYTPIFDEVKKNVFESAQSLANDLFYTDYANNIYAEIKDLLSSGNEFKETLKKYNLSLQTTEAFSLNKPLEGMLLSEIMRQTYSSVEGTLSSFITSDGLMLLYVESRAKESAELLNEKRPEITAFLKQQKILDLIKNRKQNIVNEANIELYQEI